MASDDLPGGTTMSPTEVVLEGTLKPDGTLELDAKPQLPPGRVRVTVASALAADQPKGGTWAVLQRIWAEQKARGHRPRTKDQIDAELDALRGEWEDRLEELRRSGEEKERPKETPPC
jgi:hypothetical protein